MGTLARVSAHHDDPLSAPQAAELVADFTAWLTPQLPPDWQQLLLTFRSVGDHVELPAHVVTARGAVPWEPPAGVAEFFRVLRARMARPDDGAWTTAWFRQLRSGGHTTHYDWADEPAWTEPPPAECFRQELDRHPRADDRAEWLRRRAAATD
jgi:hypothetical protein